MKSPQSIKIGRRVVGAGQPVFIIAEAGVNHNGDVRLAKKLIDVAKAAGADAVKFQTFKAEELVTSQGEMAAYQKRNTGKDESQLAMLKKLELSDQEFAELSAYAKKKGIIFLSTPHSGFASVDVLQKLKVPAFKFGSADINNIPVLAYAARLKKPIIISTGMATLADAKEAVRAIRKTGNTRVIVFQCTTDYPANPKDVNLRAMQTLHEKLGVVVGYSDHTIGAESSIAAVALGACVLEKHFTLDKTMDGPDHKASADPQELADYVRAIRTTETMLGSAHKTLSPSAKRYIPLVKKSIVARSHIKKGERFTPDNVAIKRPGKGLPPRYYADVLGKKATRAIAADAYIRKGDYGN